MIHRTALIGALLLAAAPASAQVSVAIVAAASAGGVNNCRFQDPRDRLLATGLFADVELFDLATGTPALDWLLERDAVLVWSQVDIANPAAAGDVLADYVDAGGGVVVAVFANSSPAPTRRLRGRWETGGYETIVAGGGTTTGRAQLGTVHVPSHPVLAGVQAFDGGLFSNRPTTTALRPGSALVAEWSDGKVLVAENHGWTGRRVDLGFHPPSTACTAIGWDETTDGDLLMANALAYTATAGAAIGADACTPAVPNSTGEAGRLTVTGSVLAAGANVRCTVDRIPSAQFGYLVASQTLGFLANPGGSQGNLCVLGSQARYNAPGQVGQGPVFALDVGALLVPTNPPPGEPILAGQTWYWQAWYRDAGASNFTNAVGVAFL